MERRSSRSCGAGLMQISPGCGHSSMQRVLASTVDGSRQPLGDCVSTAVAEIKQTSLFAPACDSDEVLIREPQQLSERPISSCSGRHQPKSSDCISREVLSASRYRSQCSGSCSSKSSRWVIMAPLVIILDSGDVYCRLSADSKASAKYVGGFEITLATCSSRTPLSSVDWPPRQRNRLLETEKPSPEAANVQRARARTKLCHTPEHMI